MRRDSSLVCNCSKWFSCVDSAAAGGENTSTIAHFQENDNTLKGALLWTLSF